jgi:uncharacterized protein involved in exopolysaccharide biosynthesis
MEPDAKRAASGDPDGLTEHASSTAAPRVRLATERQPVSDRQFTALDPDGARAEASDALSTRELLAFFARHAIVIVATVAVAAAIGFSLASVLPRKYRAIVVTVPAANLESGSSAGLMSQLGGLAQVAGLPISGNTARDEAYEVLRSRALAQRFIDTYHIAPLLFPKRWDTAAGRWRTTGRGAPSVAEQVGEFDKKIRTVSQDKLTGTVRVSATWRDRNLAAQWANALVAMANDELRTRAQSDAAQMVAYLNKQLETTASTEVRQSLYRLMEEQLKKGAIANVSREYAFKTVDPAMIPDSRDWVSPSRIVFSVLGALLGAMLGALLGYRRDRGRKPAP